MLPRLQAEEMLDGARMVALGSGALKPMDAQRAMARLERQARPGPAAKADPRTLAMMGIRVVVDPGSGSGAGVS